MVITARHAQQLNEVVDGIRAKGGKAVGVVADVCSTEDTKKVFDTALKEFGDVDILINNAGIGEQKMIDETDDDWMLYVMNTNLGGPMRYIREAAENLPAKKRRRDYQHLLGERYTALLRCHLYLHQGGAEHPDQERGDAAH